MSDAMDFSDHLDGVPGQVEAASLNRHIEVCESVSCCQLPCLRLSSTPCVLNVRGPGGDTGHQCGIQDVDGDGLEKGSRVWQGRPGFAKLLSAWCSVFSVCVCLCVCMCVCVCVCVTTYFHSHKWHVFFVCIHVGTDGISGRKDPVPIILYAETLGLGRVTEDCEGLDEAGKQRKGTLTSATKTRFQQRTGE